MEKIKITLEINKKLTKLYEGMTYQVMPYILLEDKLQIVESYLESLFANTDATKNYLTAEYSLMLSVIDFCTNIDIDDEDIIKKLVATGLWDDIRKSIVNYNEFRGELDKIVKMKQFENSVSSNLNALILRIYDFIENISELDFSENGMKQLSEGFEKLSKNVDGLKNTFGEGAPEKKSRGRPKKNV